MLDIYYAQAVLNFVETNPVGMGVTVEVNAFKESVFAKMATLELIV